MRTSIFVFCLLFGVIFAKSCLDEVKELEAKPPMVGAYKPICQTNGLYAETQYHASYYFCVNPKTGEKILGTDVRFRKPSSCKTTPCMLQRHQGMLNSKQGMVGHFTPQCEEDGSFKKVQCHASTGFCYCVVPETGAKVVGTEVRGKPTNCEATGVNNAKTCLKHLQELDAKPALLGAFRPVCQANGLYAETQCHGSTGFCFCVVPETGKKILGTEIRGKPKSCKASPCLLARHEGLLKSQKMMVGHFTPQCEEDGSFKKVQCHASTGFCYCVVPETGAKVVGTEVRGKPTNCEATGVNNAKTCLKHLQELDAKPALLGAFRPVCQANGLYAETQCHGSTGFCFCVVPETGKKILGTEIRGKPKSCRATPCMLQRHQGMLKSQKMMVGHFTPQCEEDGSFKKVQCHGSTGYCFCVAADTGVKVEGTEVRGKPTNCETADNADKPCLKQLNELQAKQPLLGQFKPKCQANGMFAEMQSHAGYHYCVFPKTGEEIKGTRIRFAQPKTCKATPCLIQRHHAMKDSDRGMVGQFTPQCETDGSFTVTQCHSSTGFCFCVVPETGEKLLGTELRFKKPKNCEMTECMHERHQALKSGLLGIFKPACDEDGLYSNVQCTEGICYCVFAKTGAKVLGTELERGVRPTTCELTKCFKKRHEFLSQTQPLLGARKPVCTADGNFNAVQCHEGVCHCVFPTTGEEVLGTMTRFRKPQSCKLTQCVLARHKGWKMASYGLLGVRIPRCAPSGDYQKVQCRNGMCWCVNPTTGKAVAGKSAQWTVPSC